ncbi:DUF6250 domain-containing protein [Pseudoduganella sp. RAF53_2]|uniref:DUF6250 domain-containing protein n=1 Tax=unclassified Pseudoduganella TaxID=2637179 RepID=UPI003F97BADD
MSRASRLPSPSAAHATAAAAPVASRAVAVAVACAAAIVLAPTMASAASAEPCAGGTPGKLLYADDFRGGLAQWVPEYRPTPNAQVAVRDGKLMMDLPGDATVWFKPELQGDIQISYKRKMIMAGGPNDRLSDLNQFWMASDPQNTNLFTRDGTFKQYDALSLYYVGIGGNTNTTTRFRKYDGKGERVLLGDLTDQAHLLQANREYAIQITVYQGCTRMTVDGQEYFSWRDPAPLRSGHFGFRTTHSHQEISDFKVYQLK